MTLTGRALVAFAMKVSALFALITPASVLADGGASKAGEWAQVRTVQGCLVYWYYYFPGRQTAEEYQAKWQLDYSGTGCEPNKIVDGEGELSIYDRQVQGPPVFVYGMSGRFKNGIIDGQGADGGIYIRGCWDQLVKEGACIPFTGKAHKLAKTSSEIEPGPLGLRDVPASGLPHNRGAQVNSAPEFVIHRWNGPIGPNGRQCLEMKIDSPFELNERDNDWVAVLRVESTCPEYMWIRLDTAVEIEGQGYVSYSTRGDPLSFAPLAKWPPDTPFPPPGLGFQPVDSPTGTLFSLRRYNPWVVDASFPKTTLHVWMVGCFTNDPKTGTPLWLMVSEARLMDNAQFSCVEASHAATKGVAEPPVNNAGQDGGSFPCPLGGEPELYQQLRPCLDESLTLYADRASVVSHCQALFVEANVSLGEAFSNATTQGWFPLGSGYFDLNYPWGQIPPEKLARMSKSDVEYVNRRLPEFLLSTPQYKSANPSSVDLYARLQACIGRFALCRAGQTAYCS